MSAVILMEDINGKYIHARALLDTCSTAHLITEKLASSLKLPLRNCSTSISAINGISASSSKYVQIKIKSLYNDFQKTLTCITIPKIAEDVPSARFPRELVKIPTNIQLADPKFHEPRNIDLLIGSGATLSLLSAGQIKLSREGCDLFAQKTQLGWVISGGTHCACLKTIGSCHLTNLAIQMNRLWEIEGWSSKTSKKLEEFLSETHYADTTTRDSSGRYIVRLPFRTGTVELGDSRANALRRFYALEKRLKANPDLNNEYRRVMQEYISFGHMSKASNESENGYYMPHHPVVKEASSTTKVRVVFNASSKTDKGLSLNSVLMVGPTIQSKIFEHLLRFRVPAFVLTADIAQMYRQVLIGPCDRKFQRVFWYDDQNNIKTYTINTVAFGVSSAPFLAIRTIQQLADDEGSDLLLARKVLKRGFYVDDFLTGANSLKEIMRVRDEVIELLARGGFKIRKWASNHQHALDNVNEKILDIDCSIQDGPVQKTLGVTWNSRHDTLIYSAKAIDTSVKITKRNILSETAKIFDPLGLLGPVILAARLIMQKCWAEKVGWDESVTSELQTH